jgi:hypothetical protein
MNKKKVKFILMFIIDLTLNANHIIIIPNIRYGQIFNIFKIKKINEKEKNVKLIWNVNYIV